MKNRFKIKLLTLSLICAQYSMTVLAQVRFADDFEGTFNPVPSNQVYNQWYKSGWNDGGYMVPTDEITARHGAKSLKAIMVRNTDGNSRTEAGVNLTNSFGDYWYGLSTYIPEEIDLSKAVTDGNWHTVIAQWGVWLNNPGLPDFALRMDQNVFRITYEPSTGAAITLFETPLIQGRWVDWVFHIDWTNENDGMFEVWQDQLKIFEKVDFQTTDGTGDDVKSKIGLYYSDWGDRASSLTSIYCYYDSYKIASGKNELLSVAPWAEGSSEFAPSGLFAESVSYKQIDLTWRDNSTDELGFIIERKSESEENFFQIATVDSNVTSYTDSGLSPSSAYIYRVSAFNIDSILGYSNEAYAETFTIGGVYQETDSIISIEAEHGVTGGIWTIKEDDRASDGNFIEAEPDSENLSDMPSCILPDCITSYYFNLENRGNYRFWFRILSDSDTSDSFFWRIDDGAWIKEENRSGIGRWIYTDNIQTDNLTDGSHILEISYGERGTRLDKFVIQPDSYPDILNEGPPESKGTGISPPLSPGNLTASAVSESRIELSWTDHSSDEEGFKVERRTDKSSFWTLGNIDSNTTNFTDQFLLNPSTKYTYRIRAYRGSLLSNYSNESSDTTFADPTDINEKSNDDNFKNLNLEQNYPNPANPSTVITFSIPKDKIKNLNFYRKVNLTIYSILGKRIITLLDEEKSPGNYSINFNPELYGKNFTSGVYLYRLSYGGESISKKLILIK